MTGEVFASRQFRLDWRGRWISELPEAGQQHEADNFPEGAGEKSGKAAGGETRRGCRWRVAGHTGEHRFRKGGTESSYGEE